MQSFFDTNSMVSTRQENTLLPKCGSCGLFKTCKSPYMPVSGKGKRKILIFGEAPGENEDNQDLQFVGKAGNKLQELLDEVGLDLREDCWATNSLICRPPNNAKPTKQEISYCRPNLAKTIRELKPEVIIPLGEVAMSSILPLIWQQETSGITKWAGLQIPSQVYNAWICPTFHPSYLVREESQVLENFVLKHLNSAAKIETRPWNTIPDYSKQITLIHDDRQAYEKIMDFAEGTRLVAFDYETNMLKPDSEEAAIYSCSISDGKTTISFPWLGKAVKGMKEFLRSDVPKTAQNKKFEMRWSKSILGIDVVNLDWCSMIAEHIINGMPGVVGLDFMSLIYFGMPTWDASVSKYMRSKVHGGNNKNNIDKCPLDALLLYGGIDSLLELKITKIQMKELGFI